MNSLVRPPKSIKGLLKRATAIATFPLIYLRWKLLRRRILSSAGKNLSQERIREMIRKRSKRVQAEKYFFGKCNICGSDTAFYHLENESYRESLFCINCQTISRYRSIARGLLLAIRDLTAIEAPSISHLPFIHDSCLHIYDTQSSFYGFRSAYPVPDLLARCKWIQIESSVYDSTKPLGVRIKAHQTNQNIETLTFPDESFDIVITSDVMEHVRLDDRAYREIRRILKPGGIYLFTVPSIRDNETQFRVRVSDPFDSSQDEFLVAKEFHDDPNRVRGKSLAYRVYGTDLDRKLKELGFNVHYEWQNIPELGILETELFFCKLQNSET